MIPNTSWSELYETAENQNRNGICTKHVRFKGVQKVHVGLVLASSLLQLVYNWWLTFGATKLCLQKLVTRIF